MSYFDDQILTVNHHEDETVSTDDTTQLLDLGSDNLSLWSRFKQTSAKKKIWLFSIVLLMVAFISVVVIGVIASRPGPATPTPTMGTSTTPIVSSSMTTIVSVSTTHIDTSSTTTTESISTTPIKTNSTTPEDTSSTTTEETTSSQDQSTITSVKTTVLPVCPYKDKYWYEATCPDGKYWACWSDKNARDKNCEERGWPYGLGKLKRRWPKEDCFCCSGRPCTYP